MKLSPKFLSLLFLFFLGTKAVLCQQITAVEKYNTLQEFYKFIEFKKSPTSFNLTYDELMRMYIKGQLNKLDSAGKMTGLWVITTSNKDYTRRLSSYSYHWMNERRAAFAVLNSFKTIKDQRVAELPADADPANFILKQKNQVNLENRTVTIGSFYVPLLPEFDSTSYRIPVPSLNDTILEAGFHWNSLREGTWVYFNSNKSVRTKIQHHIGRSQGMAMTFENDKVIEQGYWENNRWVGNYLQFYPDGGLRYALNFNSEGKRQGINKFYHRNGLISLIGMWKDGIENGYALEYDSNAVLIKTKLFSFGICIDSMVTDSSEIEMMHSYVINENQNVYRSRELAASQKAAEFKDELLKNEKKEKLLFVGGLVIAVAGFISVLFLLGKIRKSRKLIMQQKEESDRQRALLEVKQKEIYDSMQYAKRIQRSLITSESYITKTLARLTRKRAVE